MGFLSKMFDTGRKELKRCQKIANVVMGLEEEYRKLTDEELQHKTVEFKERYQPLCDILMKELGAAIELTNSREGMMGCPLIGAMEAPPFRCQWDGLLLLVGRIELPTLSGELQKELSFPVPTDVKEAAPADVDPMEFYLAILKEKRQVLPADFCYILREKKTGAESFEKFL